jgi:hypothetical protein
MQGCVLLYEPAHSIFITQQSANRAGLEKRISSSGQPTFFPCQMLSVVASAPESAISSPLSGTTRSGAAEPDLNYHQFLQPPQ